MIRGCFSMVVSNNQRLFCMSVSNRVPYALVICEIKLLDVIFL